MQVMVNMYMDVRAELKVVTNGSVFKLETLQVVPALVTKVMMTKSYSMFSYLNLAVNTPFTIYIFQTQVYILWLIIYDWREA